MSPSPTTRSSATSTIRQAIGTFRDSAALEEAVSELQSHGFDRAEISFVSSVRDDAEPPSSGKSPAPSANQAGLSDTDLRQGRVLGTSIAATLAGFAAAGFVIATGGTALAAIAATVAAAGGAGAISEIVGHNATMTVDSFDDAALPSGSVVLLVHTRDRAAETRALDILRRHTAADVRVGDLPTSRVAD